MRSESCSFIWHPNVVTWKRFIGPSRLPAWGSGEPGAAARSRSASACEVGGPRLPDDGDLDVARVLELLLDLAGDLVREQNRAVVVERPRHDHDADLAAGL